MIMFPRVSVLIPTYNSAEYLDEAIQSVLSQTFTDFELIITDNRSTDNSQAVIAKYLTDPRVSYYLNETNIGMVGNWNKCLDLAKGDYIKFLCSDDKFHPELLEKFVQVMDQNPNVSLVTSDREEFGTKALLRKVPYANLQNGKKIISASLDDWNWIGEPTSVMFRRSNLSVGKFNPNLMYLTDWDMWLRQLSVGDCYIIPEVLSYFRQHPNQGTQMLKQNYSLVFEEYNFYKEVKRSNPYKIDLSKTNVDQIIQTKGINCAKVLLKVIPKLNSSKNWSLLNKSAEVLYSEKLLLPLVSDVFRKTSFRHA